MELRQLRYFVKVAKLKNFSEAARELNISQSTLSQQIKQLEGSLGVELFLRDSHHVRLTDVGNAFLPQAERTLSAANDCIEKIRDVQGLSEGELIIGSTYSFLPFLKETVLMFMRKHPGIKMSICCYSMTTLLKMVQNESVDIALSYKPLGNYPDVESHILFDNHLAVAVSESHPLAVKDKITLAELEQYPWALPAKGLQARILFDRIIDNRNYKFESGIESNEVRVLTTLVKSSNKLVTVLSGAAVNSTPGIKSLKLDEPGTEMEGAYHVLKDKYMKRSAREFLKILCENRSYSLALMNIL
ncbi:MAG: LysR family transcriptional regulator [Bacteroidales bacterium]|nr:LysR family transcriptional regulator [Bacteroidales bacterium]